jgi:hypothetical protein
MEVAMPRRSTPERLDAARRAATLARLIGDGELPDRAEGWIARWESTADAEGRRRDGAYWDAAYRWIINRRDGPPSPPV